MEISNGPGRQNGAEERRVLELFDVHLPKLELWHDCLLRLDGQVTKGIPHRENRKAKGFGFYRRLETAIQNILPEFGSLFKKVFHYQRKFRVSIDEALFTKLAADTSEVFDKLDASVAEWKGHLLPEYEDIWSSVAQILKDRSQEPRTFTVVEHSDGRNRVTELQKIYLPKLDAFQVLLEKLTVSFSREKAYRERNEDGGYPFYQGLERRLQSVASKFSSLYLQLFHFEMHFINTIDEEVFVSLTQAATDTLTKLVQMQSVWTNAFAALNSKFYLLIQDTKSNLMDALLDMNTLEGQINLHSAEMELWMMLSDARTLASSIQTRVNSGLIDFPWKRYTMGDVHQLFRNLQDKLWDPADVRRENFSLPGIRFKTGSFFPQTFTDVFNNGHTGYFAFSSPTEDYHSIDIITDYFQERPRMEARRKDRDESPLEWWRRRGNVERLVDELLARKPTELLSYDLREGLFPKVGECTQFKATLVKSVIEKLHATRMLDFSAGWGDRLIGAIGTASIEKYVAADPNRDLEYGHNEIIRTLAPAHPEDYRVIYQPFQEAELPAGQTFDLIFTSPPYFDFEIYTQLPGQSVLDYPKFDNWLVQFLFFSLRKAWGVLDEGGHMVIHITDTRGSQCCEPMNLFIQSRLPGSIYCGVLASMGRADKPRPMWVWRKSSTLTDAEKARKPEAESLAKKYFTNIWRHVDTALGPYE